MVGQSPCYDKGTLSWVGHFVQGDHKKMGKGYHWATKRKSVLGS